MSEYIIFGVAWAIFYLVAMIRDMKTWYLSPWVIVWIALIGLVAYVGFVSSVILYNAI